MGAGALRRKKRGPPDDGKAGARPSLERRRRALFGSAGPQQFESVAPPEQFADFLGEEAEENIVFQRLGVDACKEFRKRAQPLCDSDGYFEQGSIKLLDVGLSDGGKLTKRLFDIAQVQAHPVPRKQALTFYELLALCSVLHGGTEDELIELLFCVFDVDDDDCVSVDDFETTIGSFLDIQGALDALTGSDLEEFSNLEASDTQVSARRIAEIALLKYGSTTKTCDADTDNAVSRTSSGAGERTVTKKRRSFLCCLCKGKTPQNAEKHKEASETLIEGSMRTDDDMDDSDDSDDFKVKKRTKGQPHVRAASTDQAAAEPTKSSKNTSKRRTSCCLCRGCGRKKPAAGAEPVLAPLSFDQFRDWLGDTVALPHKAPRDASGTRACKSTFEPARSGAPALGGAGVSSLIQSASARFDADDASSDDDDIVLGRRSR